MLATLHDFALTNDSASATSSKLKKQEILSAYLRDLDESDLPLAIRYLAGRPFPATDERTLNVGGATLTETIFSLLKIDPQDFYKQMIKSGDLGEALSQIWPTNSGTGASPVISLNCAQTDGPLTLNEISHAFTDLAATGNVQRKREILSHLFTRCVHPREAAYLTKIIFHDMRTGVQEGILQASIAQAFDKPLPQIQRTHLLLGDSG